MFESFFIVDKYWAKAGGLAWGKGDVEEQVLKSCLYETDFPALKSGNPMIDSRSFSKVL